MDSISLFIVIAVETAAEGGRKSSQGFARDMTDVLMECLFMKDSLLVIEE